MGPPKIHLFIKLWFLESLILTRLMFNVHLWVAQPRELQKLNRAYMRVARRIAGQSLYAGRVGEQREHNLTDLQIRRQLCIPSIDCLVIRARLKYAGRLANNAKVGALRALLSAKPKGKPMPWASQLARDMQYMYEHTDIAKLVTPPSHRDAGATWTHVMKHEKCEFSCCVNQIFFSQSVLDMHADTDEAMHVDQLAFVCN